MTQDIAARFTLKHNRSVREALAELEDLYVDEWGYSVSPPGVIDEIEANLLVPEAFFDGLTQDELAEALGFEPSDLLSVEELDC